MPTADAKHVERGYLLCDRWKLKAVPVFGGWRIMLERDVRHPVHGWDIEEEACPESAVVYPTREAATAKIAEIRKERAR